MDADGIDAAFLCPSIGLFSGAIHDPQLAAAVCRAYNRWLADCCGPSLDRLFGIAMLPMQDVDLAVAEMRGSMKSKRTIHEERIIKAPRRLAVPRL
jgi:uncharacterized protein